MTYSAKVSVFPALTWTCPNCGTYNYSNIVPLEGTPEDRQIQDQIRQEEGLPEEVDLTGVCCKLPACVVCHQCKDKYKPEHYDVV